MSTALDRLGRRLHMLAGLGRTTKAARDDGNVQTVQLRLNMDGVVVDDVPVLQLFGISGSAPEGSDVVYLALGGDRSKLVAIGTAHQASRPRNRGRGETVVYNAFNMTITLGKAGMVVDCAGQPLTFKNATKARFEMPVESTGEITAQVDGAFVTLSGHKGHSGGGQKPTPNT